MPFLAPETDEAVGAGFTAPDTDEVVSSRFTAPEDDELLAPDSAVGSFFRGLKHRGLAGLGGLAGGAAAGALVPGLGETGISEAAGGIIGLGAGLLGATGGGAAGEWLNQKLLGPEGIAREKAQLEANRLAGHDFATESGEMIPALLPAMRGGPAATSILGKLGHAGESFARMGAAGEGAHQVETGEFDPAALVTHPLESAITGAAVGLVPGMSVGAKYFGKPAAEVLGSILGKAPADAAMLTLSGQLYNHYVHGAPLSLEGVTDDTGKAIPGFMLLNALTGVAGLPGAVMKAREVAKDQAPPPATEGLHMQGFKEPNAEAAAPSDPATAAIIEPVADLNAKVGNPLTAEALAGVQENIAQERQKEEEPTSPQKEIPTQESSNIVPDGTSSIALTSHEAGTTRKESVPGLPDQPEAWSENVPEMPPRVSGQVEDGTQRGEPTQATQEGVTVSRQPGGSDAAANIEAFPHDSRSASEGQRTELREGVSPTGEITETAMPSVREHGQPDAPPGLQQAVEGGMAMPETPLGSPQQGWVAASEAASQPSADTTAPELTGDKPWELLSFTPQTTTSHDDQQRLNALERGFANDPRTAKLGLVPRAEDARPMEDAGATDSAGPSRGAAALASIEAFAKATGRRVIFIGEKDNHPLPFNAVIMPEHPDTIFINKNGDRHLLALLGHEWAHTVKIADPELHDAFQKEVLRQLGEKYKAMEEAGLKRDYPLEDLPEEVASNVAGDVFMQPEFWQKLQEHDRPLWERMVDAVGKWLDEMVAKITKSEFGTTEAVQSMEETRQAVLDLMNGSTKDVPGLKFSAEAAPEPAPRDRPTPSWGQTVKEMREANAKGVIPAHQVTHDLDDLLSGKKKAIVLNGIKDERAAITLGNTLGFRVAELPNHLGWIGYLEPDAWKPVYDAYKKNLMVEGQEAHLDPMAHSEIAKAMGVDQEQIDNFYRAMLKKHGLKFQSDKEEDAEDDGDLGRDMTVAGIEETYREWSRKAPGGRPYMNMDDTTSAAHVELLRNPEKPQELANAILTDNHKATPREKALMAVGVVQLHNIIDAHPGDPSNIALYDKLDNLYRAYRLDSSSWGQEGNVIQQRIKKDYTPAGLLRRVRMATGKEPTEAMRAKIDQFAKEFAAATEQEKQDAFSYTKKVAHELMEKLEQEHKAREEEGSHWIDEAMESLDEEARTNVDNVLEELRFQQLLAQKAAGAGLKFSSDVERTAANRARDERLEARIKSLGTLTQDVVNKAKAESNAKLEKAARAFVDPKVKEDIKKAVGGDKVALKLLDDLSKQPKAKPAKAPDPVKKRFADEVRHPGDATKFAEDMKKLGVQPETAEKLHIKAKEKRETMVKRKFAKDKSSEASGSERDDDAPLSIGEIEQALREQEVSHVSEVDASLLEEAMRTLVASGHRGEAEVIPELHKLVAKAGISGDVDEVREAAVKYGAKRRVPSPEELDIALRQVRSEAQKMAQIMHVLHHAELPSGFGPLRDKPHQKLRELYKQLKDVIAKANIKLRSSEAQLASAQDATLTRLRNDIEDLEAQIADGKRKIRDKAPAAHSPEFLKKQNDLKARKAELQEALESIDPKKAMDEAERERRLIAAGDRVAKHWAERVKNGEWEDKQNKRPVSQAVIDARKIASDAKELFEQAKDAARPDFKVGERIDMRKKQIDSLIQKARERLAFGKKQKGNGIYTPEAEASVFAEQQALIDELQLLRVEIEGKPGMSDEQRVRNAENAAEKAIARLEEQIASGDFTPTGKPDPVRSAKLDKMREDLDVLREVRDAMKHKERPDPELLAIKRYSRLLDRRKLDLERRIRDKDFSKVERKKTPENFENEVKKLAIAKLQRRFNQMVKEEVDKNRTPLEKFYDYIPKLKRAFVLSYPAVVGKLTAAAAMRGLTTVSEELVGGALSKVLPKELVRKAEIEGGMLSASGWSEAVARWWDHVSKDVKDTVKEGSSDLDDLFGKGGHESDWWGFFGRIHAALKAPVKRMRFEMAMEKQAEAYQRGGGDPTDLITNPLLAAKTGAKAYQAANRDIFLQDNILVDRYTTFVNLLAGAKGTAGPATARILRTLLPIVKVPTNIVMETSQHIAGVPIALARLGHIWQRGMETITPEESESIMRMMKKGSLGAGLMLLGFYAAGPNFAAGGYYSHDDKRKPGDPKVGGFKVFGMDVPTWMTHAPAFEAIQVGATFRRGLNSHQHTKSIPSAALASMVGLAEETPFLNEIFRSKYMTTAKGQEQFIAELAKAQLEPGLISQIATWTDRSRPLKPADLLTGEGQQRRKPNGFTEILKSGVPGMRKGLSYAVDSPFSPREEHPPEVLHDYAQKGHPMPTTPTRAPLEKKQGRPISNEMWNAYADIRGRAVEREMLANIGFLMAPMSEKAKKQKVMEIARKASYEATQALGLK